MLKKLMIFFKMGILPFCMAALLSSCVTYIDAGPQRYHTYTRGYWDRGYWVPAHYSRHYIGPSYNHGGAAWVSGYWSRHGQWVPGHWRY